MRRAGSGIRSQGSTAFIWPRDSGVDQGLGKIPFDLTPHQGGKVRCENGIFNYVPPAATVTNLGGDHRDSAIVAGTRSRSAQPSIVRQGRRFCDRPPYGLSPFASKRGCEREFPTPPAHFRPFRWRRPNAGQKLLSREPARGAECRPAEAGRVRRPEPRGVWPARPGPPARADCRDSGRRPSCLPARSAPDPAPCGQC